jgi:hypothetical protein
LETFQEITALVGGFHGSVIGFEEQLKIVATECVTHPELKNALKPMAETIKTLQGDQQRKFLEMFKHLACLEEHDCKIAARMDEAERRIRDLEDTLAENSPSQVLPSPAPSFGEVVPAPEPVPTLAPQYQPRTWIGPVHGVIDRPVSGKVTLNQPPTLVFMRVKVPWSNGRVDYGNMYQLANGQYILVRYASRIAYQSYLARR